MARSSLVPFIVHVTWPKGKEPAKRGPYATHEEAIGVADFLAKEYINMRPVETQPEIHIIETPK